MNSSTMVEKFIVEKFMVEKFMLAKFMVEKIMVEISSMERFMGLESSIWLWCRKFQS